MTVSVDSDLNATTSSTAAATTIANDTTTNATMYPTWVTASSGDLPLKVSSTKITFNPSTGTLTSTLFNGPSDANVFGSATMVASSAGWVSGGIFGIGGGSGTSICNTLFECAAQNVCVFNSGLGLYWSSSGAGAADASTLRTNKDTSLFRVAAAHIRQGEAASATPVAQTTSVQNASGTDIAGATRTYIASLGTGAGTPGTHVFQTGATLGTGTTLQTATTRFTIAETRLTAAVPVVLPSYVAASLPTGAAGMRAFCTDANATTFASIVAGGGANGVPVYHDGTNWRIG